jgi:hypothetical protein
VGEHAGCPPPGGVVARGRLRLVELGESSPAPRGQVPLRPGEVARGRRRRVADVVARRPLRDDLSSPTAGPVRQELWLHGLDLWHGRRGSRTASDARPNGDGHPAADGDGHAEADDDSGADP